MTSVASSVFLSVLRAWAPETLTSSAVSTSAICSASQCVEPPPAVVSTSLVTWAGVGVSAQDPPCPSLPLPARFSLPSPLSLPGLH